MTFAEKLNSLLMLTGTSNSRLAKKLNIDASLVSRWRNGTRTPVNNPLLLGDIAEYFAQQISTEAQRSMLRSLLGRDLDGLSSVSDTGESIVMWLAQDKPILHDFVNKIQMSGSLSRSGRQQAETPLQNARSNLGQVGRQHALDSFFRSWEQHGSQDGVLLIYCDESTEWMDFVTNYAMKRLSGQDSLADELRQVKLIFPASFTPKETIRAVNFVIPFVKNGTFQIYCLMRNSPNLFRHFIMAARGIGVVASTSLDSVGPVTVFEKDEAFVSDLCNSFTDSLDSCTPLLIRWDNTGLPEAIELTRELLYIPSDLHYRGNMLPNVVLPPPVLAEISALFTGVFDSPGQTIRAMQQYEDAFHHYLAQNRFCMCTPLYSPADVESGAVSTPSLPRFVGSKMVFTPERYLKILYNLLHLLEHHENFELQVVDERRHHFGTFLQEGRSLYIATNQPKVRVYVSDRPIVLQAMQHHLQGIYDAIPIVQRTRRANREKLCATISLFEKHLEGGAHSY